MTENRTVMMLDNHSALVLEHWSALTDEARTRIEGAATDFLQACIDSECGVTVAKIGPRQNLSDLDVQRLSLRPGDKVVLRIRERLTQEHAERLRAQAQGRFPGHEVIVLDASIDLAVLAETA